PARADAGQLLRDLSKLPADAAPGLHDDGDDLAAGAGPYAARLRVALPSRRSRPPGIRLRRCRRVLGPHQPRGLENLGTLAARDRIAWLHAGPVLGARIAAVGIRSLHPS